MIKNHWSVHEVYVPEAVNIYVNLLGVRTIIVEIKTIH